MQSYLFYCTYLWAFVCQTDDTWLNHLMVQIVSFTSSLSHTSKHRVATMSFGNIVNQFHDQHSLADSSTTKQTWHWVDIEPCSKNVTRTWVDLYTVGQSSHSTLNKAGITPAIFIVVWKNLINWLAASILINFSKEQTFSAMVLF